MPPHSHQQRPSAQGKARTSSSGTTVRSIEDPIARGYSSGHRNHRKRQKEYMNALEEEVHRLRHSEANLTQAASYWKKCALALMSPVEASCLDIEHALKLSPGLFIWVASELDWPVAFSPGQAWHQLPPPQPPVHSSTILLSQLGARDALLHMLLQNFLENIMPTLDVTEKTSNGYAKYVMPLALNSEMVLSSFLAASASHMQLTMASAWTVHCLKYRATAITGLSEPSSHSKPDSMVFLSALATVLGLMIEDMITCNREFAALLKLAHFWIGKDSHLQHGPHERATRQFLLDQIQMLKALVYPLYQFDWSLGSSKGKTRIDQQISLFDSPQKLYETFRAIENATRLACHVYKLTSITDSSDNAYESAIDADILLDNLQSTVHDIPPFAPSENALVWVYFIAAKNSTQAGHRSFFTSRLAELLHRIDHDDINEILAKINLA